jgi:hypothetical protein
MNPSFQKYLKITLTEGLNLEEYYTIHSGEIDCFNEFKEFSRCILRIPNFSFLSDQNFSLTSIYLSKLQISDFSTKKIVKQNSSFHVSSSEVALKVPLGS